MRLRWDVVTWASWLITVLGGTLVFTGLVLTIRGEDSAYALVIVGAPVGLAGGLVLALHRRAIEPTHVTRRANIAANLLFIGFSLILTMLTAVIEQGRSLWYLLVPITFLGLGLYTLGRQRP